MRQDIEIHIQTGDIALAPQGSFKLREFRWVDAPTLSNRYLYGEVDLPYSMSERVIQNQGFHIEIPYTPVYKEFKLRIRRVSDGDSFVFITNRTDGTQWFPVRTSLYGGDLRVLYVSMLPTVSSASFFIKLEDGMAKLYSSGQSDFHVINADRQNANCLLACVPGCHYRYPLAGVGLVRWVNSNNVASAGLTKVLQEEFTEDGYSIKNAAFNYDTQQMEMEIEAFEDL